MKTLLAIIACVTLCVTLNAQTNQPNALERGWQNVKSWTHVESGDLFQARETHLTLSGTYTAKEPGGIGNLLDNDAKHGPFGVDVGLSYFLSKYIGVGADVVCTDLNNPSSQIIDQLNLNAIVRIPINRIAPYAIVTVGRSFQRGLYNFAAGPGLEVRVNKGIGLFIDSRFQWQMDSRNDSLLARAGVNFNF